jgi:2-methylaconitate cis-trans-isomerase PrpF
MGYGQATEGCTKTLSFHQVNLGRKLLAKVPMRDDQPEVEGNFSIGGVHLRGGGS